MVGVGGGWVLDGGDMLNRLEYELLRVVWRTLYARDGSMNCVHVTCVMCVMMRCVCGVCVCK